METFRGFFVYMHSPQRFPNFAETAKIPDMSTYPRLSINVNKIALLRNARGSNEPDLLKMTSDIERYGAQGITVHPRPDERHITYNDVRMLKNQVLNEFNVEGNPTKTFIDLVKEVKPHQVTLVPDEPDALTSDTGWDTIKHKNFLKEIATELKSLNIRVSVFLNPDLNMVEAAAQTGIDRIELYTGPYAIQFKHNPEAALRPYAEAAQRAVDLGLGINAGHDLNLANLAYLSRNLPGLSEVSIGHALICDALIYGMENVVGLYLRELRR